MSDRAYIWISLWLVMLLVFVLALLIGRRFRALVKNDWNARYRMARVSLILFGIITVLMTVTNFQRHDLSGFKKLLGSACFALCFGISFFQFLQPRRTMREEPGFAE